MIDKIDRGYTVLTPANFFILITFKELGLSEPILRVLDDLGFETPTTIQEEAIPALLEDDSTDFIGLAQTGTGKTAAFGLPLLERLDPELDATQGLILSPTRELGQQIARQLEIFGKNLRGINTLAVYGGASIVGQLKELRRRPQHVIIATPGRLIDLLKRKAVNLEQLKYVVFDEADEMLNMGFKDELDEILQYTPDTKRTWLFSATMPPEIKRIADTYMTDPVVVRTNSENKVNTDIEHKYVILRQHDKPEALLRFLDAQPGMRGVVFCRTRLDTQELAEMLMQRNYRADALHGDLNQPQRDRVMQRFKRHELQVLVATDVAARGIDVDDLTHVFHYTLPDDAEYYTHRSGRTGRAGKKGTSIAFVSPNGKGKLSTFARQLKITFKRIMVPSQADIIEERITEHLMELLQTPVKGADLELMENASMLFGNLSKDELIAKIIAHQIANTPTGSDRELNSEFRAGGGGGGGGKWRKSGGGYKGKKRYDDKPNFKKKGEFSRKKKKYDDKPKAKKNKSFKKFKKYHSTKG